ncbi:MAG TPA: TolC family protein [Chitinophagaceae bacterium]|nr:TolC family protein [Chitinophagaceae bacterium]
MKKIIIGCYFLLLYTEIMAQEKRITLKECVETALQNNLEVQQAELQKERSEIDWKQSKANMLPNISGNINYGTNQGRSIDPFTNSFINQQLNFSNLNANGSIPVFSGLQIQSQIRQNNLALQASKMDWQQAKDNLTLDVILSYLIELNNEDVLMLSKAQLEVTKKQVERLETLYSEGAIASYTLTDLKGQLASDEVLVVNAENNVTAARLSLAQLMNIPFDENLLLEKIGVDEAMSLYENASNTIYEEALKKLGLIKAVDLRKQSAEKAIKVARSGYYPTLSFFGGLGTNYSSAAQLYSVVNEFYGISDSYVTISGNNIPVNTKQLTTKQEPFGFFKQYNYNLNTQFGLSLRVPIANNFRVRNQVALAKINYKNAKLVADNTRIELQQNIEQAYQNMRAAYNRYKILIQQVAAYEESFRAADVRFNNGVINSVEYLQVKNNLDKARINLTQAKYEYVLRTKVLDFYQSKLNW